MHIIKTIFRQKYFYHLPRRVDSGHWLVQSLLLIWAPIHIHHSWKHRPFQIRQLRYYHAADASVFQHSCEHGKCIWNQQVINKLSNQIKSSHSFKGMSYIFSIFCTTFFFFFWNLNEILNFNNFKIYRKKCNREKNLKIVLTMLDDLTVCHVPQFHDPFGRTDASSVSRCLDHFHSPWSATLMTFLCTF